MALGKIAGRYELQEQLGEGGMGVVWRALDTKTRSAVAIKVIRDISDPNAIEMFTKEWRTLAEMSHPNIVEVRDVDVIEEDNHKKPFFVMPLLQGATLADLISHSSSRLTVDRVVEVIAQVCKGLQAAHQRGLVHRDLKPSNIFVMDDYTAKIIDFGVVYLAGAKSTTSQKGTWQYMSPEQAQLKEITAASDIFSLGVVLYEVLTMRKPFARTTIDETIKAICKYIPPQVSEINPAVNDGISRVVHKCMAKAPMHRFPSANELAETLMRAYRNEAIFDPAKIQPRIERAKNAFKRGDDVLASEILEEIEAEGHLDPEITVLRVQIDVAAKVRKIRYLLEGARSRMEQDEIPLALEKIREALELDPGNADAIALRATMKKQRNESQIAKWLELAQRHINNRDFGAARNAVQEVLAINRTESRGLDLFEKIEQIEEESKRIRALKQDLYNSALHAYQNDQIDTALSKLERLFVVGRSNPEAAIPERDAVYQSFYKEVRSERDSIRSAIEEAQRYFSDQQFAEALRICREGLTKHPSNGALHALKIQIEDAERLQLSTFIAEVSKRVEAETDLDRRVNILREASELYPGETQFAQQLKVVRERRDLVNAVVTKARQLEERGQYSEALSQWDMLRNIHPQYPGLAFDLEQCRKKRDLQVVDEERSRAVEEIGRLIETRSFAKAIDRAHAALREFTGDPELVDLEKSAKEALDRIKESRWLFDEGQRAYQEKDLARAAETLRKGVELDPRSPALRESLINVLSEWSRSLIDTDLRQAESLFQECKGLDPTHATVQALNFSVSEAKRQATVTKYLAKARDLEGIGDIQPALDLVKTARAEYPLDTRLEQYEATLLRKSKELQFMQEFVKPNAEVIQMPALELARAAELKVHPVLPPAGALAEVAATISEIADQLPKLVKSNHLDPAQEQPTKVYVIDEPVEKNNRAPRIDLAQIWRKIAERVNLEHLKLNQLQHFRLDRIVAFRLDGLQNFRFDRLKVHRKTLSIGVAVFLAPSLALAGYLIIRHVWAIKMQTQSGGQRPPTSAHIVTVPATATIKADSKIAPSGNVLIPNGGAVTLEISQLGYKSKTVRLTEAPREPIQLEPERLRVSLQTTEKNGVVDLDNKRIGELANGAIDLFEVSADGNDHTLTVTSGRRKLFTLSFRAIPGDIPQVAPLTAPDYFAFASLGEKAFLYGSRSLKNVRLGEDSIVDIRNSGVELPALTDQIHELTYGANSQQESVSVGISMAPVLLIHSISPQQQLVITSNVDSAALKIDDQFVKKQLRGWQVTLAPGIHRFAISADGYVTQTWTTSIEPSQILRKQITLIPVPVVARSFSVVIANGTPLAEVLLDGKRVGDLDSNGNGRFPAVDSGGQHSITLQKEGFGTHKLEFNAQEGSTEYQISSNDAKLVQLATLSFIGSTNDLSVRYRRAGGTWQTVNPPAQVALSAGGYEILAERGGFAPYKSAITLTPGQIVTINLSASQLRPAFEDPGQVSMEGEWFKPKDPSRYVFLKPGVLNVNLVFSKSPRSSLFAKGKVMWTIASIDGNSEVQYELEDQKLTRKFAQLGKVTHQKNARVNAVSATHNVLLSVHVQVAQSRVRVTNDRGELLDDYSVVGADLSEGKIGVRTAAYFAVWADIH